jgi:hypothetical protein
MNQFSSARLVLGSAFLTALFLACASNDTATPPGTSGGTGSTGGTMNTAAAAGHGTGGSAQPGAGTGGTGTGGSVSGTGGSAGGHAATGGGAGSATTGGSAGSATTGGSAGAAVGGGAGVSATGGGAGTAAGASGSAGTGATGSCNFTVMGQTADKLGMNGIPTVGVVNWSVDLTNLTTASIDFTLMGGSTKMTAPVDVTTGPSFRTLLLGMKGSKTYSYKINVSNGTTTCSSADYMITTGSVPNAVTRITRTAGPAAASQAKGFIVASSGLAGGAGGFGGGTGGGGTSYAFIIDADGEIVWFAPAPATCSRAKMSYDGQYMWMVELNVDNMTKDGGELRRVSMDGLTSTGSIPGMANCHHDVTILPDGRAACMSWIQQPGDQPSDLLETDFQGNVKKIVTVDSKIYLGGSGLGGGSGTFHANSIHYHQKDDSYTVGDRNPNLFVKLDHTGKVLWQFGGSCTGAPAPSCVGGTWKVNHGHDMMDDGTFLFFNNGQSGASTAFFYKITETGTFAANMVDSYSPGTTSSVLGDVQRLPNGNTLVTFSTASVIHEIDPTKAVVQQISGPGGYAEWRETLYGAPPRF